LPPLRFQPPNGFPSTALPTLDGAERSVATTWSDRAAILVIGHRDCATTRLTLPYVDRLHRRKPDAAVVAVLQDDPAAARDLADDLGLELPILLEPDPYLLSSELKLRSVPTVFLVGTDGQIQRASEGFRRDDLEAIARAIGIADPLFAPEDASPARRPG